MMQDKALSSEKWSTGQWKIGKEMEKASETELCDSLYTLD